MRKIANTAELTGELERLLEYAGSFQPSRVMLADELRELSRRVAWETVAYDAVKRAMEFPSTDAMVKYLHEHPQAKRKDHWVKGDKDRPGAGKADESSGDKPAKKTKKTKPESSRSKRDQENWTHQLKFTTSRLSAKALKELHSVISDGKRPTKKQFEEACAAAEPYLKGMNPWLEGNDQDHLIQTLNDIAKESGFKPFDERRDPRNPGRPIHQLRHTGD